MHEIVIKEVMKMSKFENDQNVPSGKPVQFSALCDRMNSMRQTTANKEANKRKKKLETVREELNARQMVFSGHLFIQMCVQFRMAYGIRHTHLNIII